MSADMAEELRDHKVTVVSLWPGTVKTENSYELLRSGKLSQLTKLPQVLYYRLGNMTDKVTYQRCVHSFFLML